MDDGGYGLGPAYREVRTVYEVVGSDDNDREIHYGYYTDSAVASKVSTGKGSWGRDGLVRPRRAIVDDTGSRCFVIANEEPIKLFRTELDYKRDQVISKLTPEERRILGV